MSQAEKPLVAIDFDETLHRFTETILNHHNNLHGTMFNAGQIAPTMEFSRIGYGDDYWTAFIEQCYEEGITQFSPPLQNSQEAIDRLSAFYRFQVVTARPEMARKDVSDWLEQHFAGLIDPSEVIMAGGTESWKHMRKGAICAEIGAVALVDDQPLQIMDAERNGVKGILFGYFPWNQVGSAGMEQVGTWLDAEEKLGNFAVSAQLER